MADARDTAAAQKVVEDDRWNSGVDSGIFSPMELTGGRPFCAGILIVHDDRLLVTLSADGVAAADADGVSWFVGGVGGGQEPGESIWDCARREAHEELGTVVDLSTSTITHLHDIDTGVVVPARSSDDPAPFAVQRLLNKDATKPFRPDLPSGPYTYFALFKASLLDPGVELLSSDDDVAALVWVPLSSWGLLTGPATFGALVADGASIASGGPISPGAAIYVKESESLKVVVPLLADQPER